MTGRLVVLVVADGDDGALLSADVRALLGDLTSVETVPGADEAMELAESVLAAGGYIPLVLVDLDLGADRGADVVAALHQHPRLRATRTVLVASRASLHDVDQALRVGSVNGMIIRPWTDLGSAAWSRPSSPPTSSSTHPTDLVNSPIFSTRQTSPLLRRASRSSSRRR